MRVIVVGGGACGASCATRLRRLNEECEITILERTNEVSIANCGLPYYCSDIISSRDQILVSNVAKFKNLFNIDVRLNTNVTSINRSQQYVVTDSGEQIPYDKLVLAQGASPIIPPLSGIDNSKVHTIRTLADADKIKEVIANSNIKNAVVIGAGFIGIEMAENFAHLGITTTVVEFAPQILNVVDYELASIAQNEMRSHGVALILNDGVQSFSDEEVTLASGTKFPYDIAILAIGVRPTIDLAKDAGLETARGIKVNDKMQTNDPNIYAGGDSVEVKSFITDNDTLVPLAGPANRQGRIIADNICGYNSTYKKTQGTAVVKVFDYTVASCGYNEKQLQREKIAYQKIFTVGNSHASYYPGALPTLYKLLFTDTGKILGVQAIGKEAVEKRIDVIATIMRNNGTVQEMLDSELCYAPPYSSAKDPVNVLGMCADNVLKGLFKPAFYEDLADAYLIDVRVPEVFQARTIPGAINLPLATITDHLDEIPRDKKVVLFCQTGYTSYVAVRKLIQHGFTNVSSFMAGMTLYTAITNDKNSKNPQKKTTPKDDNGDSPTLSNIQSAKVQIDACGLSCPGPIMQLSAKMQTLQDGEVLEITASDPAFAADVEGWCQSTGNTLLRVQQQKTKIVATIQKAHMVAKPVVAETANNAQTIVVFSGDLDKALASFIIANGARASGKEVTMFFTFWGINILRKQNVTVKKTLLEKLFAWMLPKGANKLKLSQMNMCGIGTLMMKHIMKKKNIATLAELIQQAQANGIKFIVCNMSMDVMGIKQEELIDNIEIGGVASYIAKSNNANSNLFI